MQLENADAFPRSGLKPYTSRKPHPSASKLARAVSFWMCMADYAFCKMYLAKCDTGCYNSKDYKRNFNALKRKIRK